MISTNYTILKYWTLSLTKFLLQINGKFLVKPSLLAQFLSARSLSNTQPGRCDKSKLIGIMISTNYTILKYWTLPLTKFLLQINGKCVLDRFKVYFKDFLTCNCQAQVQVQVPNPSPKSKSQIQVHNPSPNFKVQSPEEMEWDWGWHYNPTGHPPPTTPLHTTPN